MEEKQIKEINAFKIKKLNIAVLVFSVVLTMVGLVAFNVALFSIDLGSANAIAGTYILCMLLAAPTLKGFLDKVEHPCLKKLNVVAIIMVFTAILIMVVLVSFGFAFPAWFN
jgi:hypothetical protein